MKAQVRLISQVCALVLVLAVPAQAQQRRAGGHNPPRANQGHIPSEPRGGPWRGAPEAERIGAGRANNLPHVNHDRWYGRDRTDDPRYRLARPYEHGRFDGVGGSFRHEVVRIDRDQRRLWVTGGFSFVVATWDWPICADWCWDCGDDFVIYNDPDHLGWYLIYNVHTGVYVHATYMGS